MSPMEEPSVAGWGQEGVERRVRRRLTSPRGGGRRRTRPSGRQEQASCFGGLVALSTLKPAGPRFLSTAFCHSPELIILAIAVLTFSQVALSPFLRPMP